ncbi:MAG TPA: ankyrin repeat domain-containing protein [Phycisphaerae bacterium]|nr:ankyrin repeat domain-containing protein [Phycisphaerae bacterium]
MNKTVHNMEEPEVINYALLGAIGADEPETIARLIEKGANVDFRDRSGRTALHLAAEKGRPESIKALITAGADIHLRNAKGRTALYSAIFGLDSRAVEELISAGIDVNARDEKGLTAEEVARKAMMYALADDIRKLSRDQESSTQSKSR